jgi:hypothetical protein
MKTTKKTHNPVTKLTPDQVKKVDAEFDAAWTRVGNYSSEQRAALEAPAKKAAHGKTKASST